MVGNSANKSKTEIAWLWITQGFEFDSVLLSTEVGISRNYASKLVGKWHESGHLTLMGCKGVTRYYRVNQTAISSIPPGWGAEPVSTREKRRAPMKSRQQKMWNSMKINKTVTKLTLSMASGATLRSVDGYIHALVKTGYLKQLNSSCSDKRMPSRYMLVRNTGRHAPIVRRNGCWDQNQQRLYPFLVEEGEHGNVA
ncbi:hypothetical protein [Aeromonas veronii]